MLINFDFDGVIADTFDRLLAVCIAAQASIAEGRAPVERDLQTLENLTFEGLADHLEIPQMAVPGFLQAVFGLQQKEQDTVRFFPGMAALLEDLGQSSDIAIITSSSADLVGGYLAEHGVFESVSSICGGETGRSKKDSILANIEQFSANPRQTYMVGDAISDIRQGKAAGIMTVAVGWGFHDCELLLRKTPDYLADSPEELLKILRSFVLFSSTA
jgi:phosphoglycolate phosphatase